MLIGYLKNIIARQKRAKMWREYNQNNSTTCANEFDPRNVEVGNYTYGELTVLNFGENEKLKIGSFCSIASGVVFSLNADHFTNHISTFPFKVKVLNEQIKEAASKGDIIVDDDVWIGQNAIILSGVHIGQGSVIAAGAVVSKDVPAYAIVGGVPAKVIKYRYEPGMIDELLKLDYSKLTKEMIEEHVGELYQELTDVKQLEWMPRK